MKIFTNNSSEWSDWKWQQRNAIKNANKLSSYFTNIQPKYLKELENKSSRLKFQITPYMLSQIPKDISTKNLELNPWFLQFFPQGKIHTEGLDGYDGTENWEKLAEFPTSNIHHKYTNRALIRFRNCLAYCTFCFEALGTLEKYPKEEKNFKWIEWNKSIEYLRKNPDIEEVILSGGEPLLLSDSKLDSMLSQISNIKDKNNNTKIKFKRIHTRVLTHNPYRVTSKLTEIIKKHNINEIAFDVAHPSEITHEFEEAVYKIREDTGRYSPILATHTPLLKNINSDADTLWDLFSKLYQLNIKPYYLIHSMPNIPYANKHRVPVIEGVKIMKQLKRHKSNIAVPEYIVAHNDGKITVPLELNGTPEFIYTKDNENNPIIKFLNWKNKWVTYSDAMKKQ